jgi:hypothetical protein
VALGGFSSATGGVKNTSTATYSSVSGGYGCTLGAVAYAWGVVRHVVTATGNSHVVRR